MNRPIIHIVGALAILLAVIGIGASASVPVLTPAVRTALPQDAAASCVIAQGNLQWVVNGYKGSMRASGCGTVDLISCVQNTAGTVYGCQEWYGSGAGVTVWSYNAASYYGCTQRARGYSNIYGWWVGAWVRIC